MSHQYDRDGREVELTFPDGQKFWTARDGLGRMGGGYHGALGDSSVGMTVFYYSWNTDLYYFGRRWGSATFYEKDLAGRLSKLDQYFNTAPGGNQSSFAYNPASQLISETRTSDSYAWTESAAVNRNYAVNGQNQYTGTSSGAGFGYDSNGNLISTVNAPWSTSYVYDVENRLVSASGTHNASLVYDPLGRLFQISSPATGTTRFLYDGDELVAEYDGAGTMLRRYVHGDGDDDPLYWFEGAGLGLPRFPHSDRQGSIVATAEPGGVLLAINTYDEYGIPGENQRPATALGSHGRFQYTGQAWLPELGMYYYKARIYSPGLGRFLQVDPIGYDDQFNLYAYVGNDPVNRTDPTGTYGEKADAIADLMEWVSYESRIRGARTPGEKERIARDYRTNFAAKGNHAGAYRANSELQRRTHSIQRLFRDGRTPTRSALQGWAKKQGFTETSKGENSPTKYVDENGVARLTIKSGSSRTPGSEGPHVEVRDADGRRVDPATLRHVGKRTPGNHRPFDDDDAQKRKGR